MVTLPIFDDAGRLIAEPREVPEPRPFGPWNANEDSRPYADEQPCSWCAEGRRRTIELAKAGFRVSNKMCAQHRAEMDALCDRMPDKRLPQYRNEVA